jgi:hypothetical protein
MELPEDVVDVLLLVCELWSLGLLLVGEAVWSGLLL